MNEQVPVRVDIDYLARVEGETDIIVKVGDGIEDIRLNIFEPPRFFEGFLVGRKYDEVGDIVSRICGICPISHMTTALQAVENAMGIRPSWQTRRIRRLMSVSQIVASHIIHLYMLALPDYHGHPDFFSMIPSFKEEAHRFLKMKEVMNSVARVIGGRPLHPISMVVNGFTQVPSPEAFIEFTRDIEEMLPLARQTVSMIRNLAVPELERERDHVALRVENEYAINEGLLVSSRGLRAPVQDYFSAFYEKQVDYAMAKKTYTSEGNPLMVGALARVNLKHDQLHEETRTLIKELGIVWPSQNPFHNLLAQALEIYDGMLECIHILEEVSPKPEKPWSDIQAGEGVAVTEAPRGLLMHRYAINQKGVVEGATLVTPTCHNFASMEEDLRLLVRKYVAEGQQGDIRLQCEQLIRAYDPCFSCSVH